MEFGELLNKTKEAGFVEKINSSLVYVKGLPGAKLQEVIVFENGGMGQVMSLGESEVEVLVLDKGSIRAGNKVARTGEVLSIPVGYELLGKIINPLGHSIDPFDPVPAIENRRPIEKIPSTIQGRLRIKKPCETGMSLVDLMVPLGKGQRELVIGDQKTGKSRFLLRLLLTQVKQGSIGIYVALGKSQIVVRQVAEWLKSMNLSKKIIFMVANSDDALGLIYVAPYAAMSLAEYFRDEGKDVILIIDDISMHAKIYREISLTARHSPGRSSYPGDIFYTHARLLERAGNFQTPKGEFSITCLPVVEAPQGDLAGYIQTNVMSMTDGHIYFDHSLYMEGRRPAVDPFLSVTRVGWQAQSPLKRSIANSLISFLESADRLHGFASFGTELGENVKRMIEKEKKIWQFFDQTNHETIPSPAQIFIFGVIWADLWPVNVHNLVQKTVFVYEEKPVAKKEIDELIKKCDSLDSLVDRLRESDIVQELLS